MTVEAVKAVNVVNAVNSITVMLGLVRHVIIVASARDVAILVVLLSRWEFRIDVRPRVHKERTHFAIDLWYQRLKTVAMIFDGFCTNIHNLTH